MTGVAGAPAPPAAPATRTPTADERARERTVLRAAFADFACFALLAITAAASQSLTLLTEVFRFAGLFAAQWISIVALFSVHRARFGGLQYGIGKIEMLSNFMGCSALVVGGLWIVDKVLHRLLAAGPAAEPQDLALAAVVAGLAVTVNALVLVAMKAVWTADTSAIFVGKYRARQAKFLASLAAAVALACSALAQDPAVGAVFDALGALAGVVAMMTVGIRLGSRCLCSLADMNAPPPERERIEQTLLEAGLVRPGGFHLRTRRSGRFAQAEVELLPEPGLDVAGYRARTHAIERTLSEAFRGGLDVAVVLRPQ